MKFMLRTLWRQFNNRAGKVLAMSAQHAPELVRPEGDHDDRVRIRGSVWGLGIPAYHRAGLLGVQRRVEGHV